MSSRRAHRITWRFSGVACYRPKGFNHALSNSGYVFDEDGSMIHLAQNGVITEGTDAIIDNAVTYKMDFRGDFSRRYEFFRVVK